MRAILLLSVLFSYSVEAKVIARPVKTVHLITDFATTPPGLNEYQSASFSTIHKSGTPLMLTHRVSAGGDSRLTLWLPVEEQFNNLGSGRVKLYDQAGNLVHDRSCQNLRCPFNISLRDDTIDWDPLLGSIDNFGIEYWYTLPGTYTLEYHRAGEGRPFARHHFCIPDAVGGQTIEDLSTCR